MESRILFLVIDDEPELAEYTAKYFNMSGVETQYVLTAQEARDFLKNNTCSLILLDINLGNDSGFDLCREIRTGMDVPIFFISARAAEDDMLLALSIGGDDYICKPYSLGVLLAKARAVLKRYEETKTANEKATDEGVVHIGNAVFDMKKAVIVRDGKTTALKAMEYKLLLYMLKNKNRVIPKDEFFVKVWETEYVSDVTLNVHIRHLREKIEDDAGSPTVIKTKWGVGFMLEDND